MTLKDDFYEFLADSVTIAKATGYDKASQPTFAAGTAYDCFATEREVEIKKGMNQNDISKQQIYLDGDVDVKIGDKITYHGKSPPIKDVKKTKELNAVYSTIIYT